jgi:hypothetical protein
MSPNAAFLAHHSGGVLALAIKNLNKVKWAKIVAVNAWTLYRVCCITFWPL